MTQSRVNLMDPAVRADLHSQYARLRKESPVAQVDPMGLWAVSRYADVMTVLKDPQTYSSEGAAAAFQLPWLGHNPLIGAVNMVDPPRHGSLRALINRAFNTATVNRLEPMLRTVADQCVTQMLKDGEVDLVQAFSQIIPASAMVALMGLDPALSPRFRMWANDFADMGTVRPDDVKRQDEIRTHLREMEEYMRNVLDERRRNPGNDVVSDLLRAEIDGRKLTQEELMAFCFVLLPAGIETVGNQLGLALHKLMEEPELQAQVRADRATLIPRFIEEMLRYDPVGQGLMRLTTQDATLGGVQIPKHSIVLLLMASATRDEAQFPNADRFDMNRPGPQNTTFGHGIHFCVGAALARTEMRVALDTLLSRATLAKIQSKPVQWNYALLVRGPAALPATVRAP